MDFEKNIAHNQRAEIGLVQNIQSVFTYYNDDPANIRNSPEMGGGRTHGHRVLLYFVVPFSVR